MGGALAGSVGRPHTAAEVCAERGPGLCTVGQLSAHRAMVVGDVSTDNYRRT